MTRQAPAATARTRQQDTHGAADKPQRPDHAAILELQASAGNRAVTEALVVQRHNSYEHALMGDTKPGDLPSIASSLEGRAHAVSAEQARMAFFKRDAGGDPRSQFPDVRWIHLKGSQLWVSSGEVTALADYMPDPQTIDSGARSLVEPVIQRVRREISHALQALVVTPAGGEYRKEASWSKEGWPVVGSIAKAVVPDDGRAIRGVDEATSSLGPNSQQGLLARNACHFAPYSWERWALFHNQAREEAAKHYAASRGKSAASGEMLEHERLAWVNNGYANHFLQDSFAAGHLVNKTLVMQWFAEYLGKHGKQGRMFDRSLSTDMTEAAQPGLAHRNLYTGHRLYANAEQDRETGTTAVDPQTNLERRTGRGRLEGSGVGPGKHGRAFAYHQYGELLNDSYVSMAANNTHDFLNHMGLSVHNTNGDTFKVGGDGSFLMLSDQAGLRLPIEADQLADRAIQETLATGTTSVSQKSIFGYFPVSVEPIFGVPLPGQPQQYGPVELERWTDTELRRLCWEIIFPAVENLSMKALRSIQPRLIENPEMSALPS